MRIAFLAGYLSRRASGVRVVVESLSRELANRDLDVRVFGIENADWRGGDCEKWQGAPATVAQVRGPRALGYIPGWRGALDEFSPDLIHLHGLWMASSHIAASWTARHQAVLVISPHGMLAPNAQAYSPLRKRFARKLYQDRCFAAASAYHATSNEEAQDIRKYLGDVRVDVIPSGVEDIGIAARPWESRPKRIVALGRLHPVKGYELLLRSWSRIEASHTEWSLKIAGPDPTGYGDHLRGVVTELGLKRAHIGDPAFGAERDQFMSNARLFALPSETENFALTVPEALVCGTPVLASTGTPWSALPQQGCGWWTAPEPDALAQALRQAMALPDDQLAAMGRKGRAWALDQFGRDGIAARMTDFYTSLKGSAR